MYIISPIYCHLEILSPCTSTAHNYSDDNKSFAYNITFTLIVFNHMLCLKQQGKHMLFHKSLITMLPNRTPDTHLLLGYKAKRLTK